MKKLIILGSLSGYGLAVSGILILIFNNFIISKNPVTILIQILSIGLMIRARITFGTRSFHVTADTTKGKLVTNGPYRWLRHPIYDSVIYFSLACLISYPVLLSFIAVALITGGLYLRMIMEERSLRATYPEYAAYARKAKRLIPFIF